MEGIVETKAGIVNSYNVTVYQITIQYDFNLSHMQGQKTHVLGGHKFSHILPNQ